MDSHDEVDFAKAIAAAKETQDPGGLLDIYRSYLVMLARCQVNDKLRLKTDPSDLAQEVLLHAANGFAKFQGTTQEEFTAWLRSILSRVLANNWRHYATTQRRDIRLERRLLSEVSDSALRLGQAVASDLPSPSDVAIQRENAVLIADALERLPDEYRQVILLRQVEQLPFSDVAKRMGKTVDSVRNLWPRALAKLKRQLEGLR